MKKKILAAMWIIGLIGCSSNSAKQDLLTQKPASPIVVPTGFKPAEATQLTFDGENGESYFSPDGKKLIFQSKLRESHKNSQIYILDLESKKEKRITFNDGDDTCS